MIIKTFSQNDFIKEVNDESVENLYNTLLIRITSDKFIDLKEEIDCDIKIQNQTLYLDFADITDEEFEKNKEILLMQQEMLEKRKTPMTMEEAEEIVNFIYKWLNSSQYESLD